MAALWHGRGGSGEDPRAAPGSISLDGQDIAQVTQESLRAALAIVPIASLIVRATEQVARRTGDALVGG